MTPVRLYGSNGRWPLIVAVGVSVLLGSAPTNAQAPIFSRRVEGGPGVTAPKLIYKVEPKYSVEGTRAGIQGTVVFEIVVSDVGRAVDISVLSPLGFGLDEKAQEAIEKWRFEPGRKEGKSVNTLAIVTVNFHLRGRPFDSKAEESRTRFNTALPGLREKSGVRRDEAIKAIQDLATQNFPPAMYALGKLLEPRDAAGGDPERARSLIRKAADKSYAPALLDVGLSYYEGNQVPKDAEKGMHLIRDAAVLGSYEAQFYLGNRYEKGLDVPHELDRARGYFRLCAATGHADCQVRLARLLLGIPQRHDREYVQAIAWLQLAADQGQPEARDLMEKESPQLTSEQISSAKRLKPQLVHKQ